MIELIFSLFIIFVIIAICVILLFQFNHKLASFFVFISSFIPVFFVFYKYNENKDKYNENKDKYNENKDINTCPIGG